MPGFSGHLVSEQVLERSLEAAPPAAMPRVPALIGPAASLRAILEASAEPIVHALGLEVRAIEFHDRVAFAILRADTVPVGLLVSPYAERLDALWRPAVVNARAAGARWCLLFNATHLRVVDAGRLYSRRYAEVSLDTAAADPRAAAALRQIAGAQALNPGRAAGLAALIADSERHAASVCRSLRDGVLDASELLLQALVSRRTPAAGEAFDQALTIVYRLLFLLFAEARALVPVWHPVYRESYSVEQLRDAAAAGRAHGTWDALRAIGRLAHSGCSAGDLQVTPFNGRLFAPARTPLAERRDLDDRAAERSILALTTRPAADGAATELISYRELGIEQLGAVYETLLDYRPVIEQPPGGGGRNGKPVVSLRPGSGVRKSTGTFYTPLTLADYLVRETLAPLVAGRGAAEILELKVLDPSMGSGAFLVCACRYLADAYENALVESGRHRPGDFGPAEHAAARRLVAERCLYGVDVNPMAVQLARLSLWLASLAADRPLSFLDHHMMAGDSLLGTWLACLRRPPITRTRRPAPLPLFDGAGFADAVRVALPVRGELAIAPNDTPQQVRAKERALAELNGEAAALARWKRVADLWCARWFAGEAAAPPALFTDLADAIVSGNSALPPNLRDRFLQPAAAVSAERRFFHWELEFPEVFFDDGGTRRPDGGFDAILGNPPWDMIRGDAGEERDDTRRLAAATVRFTRDSGVYVSQSDGHANRYQLFVERAIALARPGGRLGLVLPAGLCTDHGSRRLREALFARCDVDRIAGFDNRRAIFPVHRSVRFVVLTATAGSATRRIACRFGETDLAALEDFRPAATLTLPALARLAGDALTIPQLRVERDLQILERATASFPPLVESWDARFGRELNATDDRGLIRPDAAIPVIGGQHVTPFRCDITASRQAIAARDASRLLGDRWRTPRLAYRDVASATNRTTLIAAIVPGSCVSTHTVFCLRTPLAMRAQQFLCGLFNSLVVNYLARLWVTTHVTTGIVERLPVPRADQAGSALPRIAAIARLLARRRDAAAFAELNARVAALYRLSSDDVAHVLGTFPLIAAAEREAMFRRFRQLE
ncbi:MAG TPA: N-6 DNA methylase [Vicinamibacterales bacterium]